MNEFLEQLDRRMDRGMTVIGAWWDEHAVLCGKRLIVALFVTILSPVLSVLWVTGYVSEFRENRRNRVENVED